MKRVVTMGLLLGGLWVIAVEPSLAQTKTDTVVHYIDPATKKDAEVFGRFVDESPAGIRIMERMAVKTIPALAITQVLYPHATVAHLEMKTPFGKENRALDPKTKAADRKTLLATAIQLFEELGPRVKDDTKVFRYIQYKIVQIKVRQAQDDPGNADLIKDALRLLRSSRDLFANGWEIVPSLTMSAKLYKNLGETDSALKAYEALLEIPDVPKEIRRESDLMVAQLLVRKKRYQEAETKLKALGDSLPADDPQKGLVQVYMVESQLAQGKLDQAEPTLRSALQASSDPKLRATAHNFLGDFYRLKKQDEDALWQYLKVDLLYSQDTDEHAKALYYLIKLYETVQGNKGRSQQCYDRLTDKAYEGSEYQRKAKAEKGPDK